MSYLADFCKMTSSTGGTGALTLTAQTGYPDVAKAITSGTRFVAYSINEYTDATKLTLSKSESGVGSYAASTGVLTRTKIIDTWNGTTYLPNTGSSAAPTAISFGSTAANIDVVVGPLSGLAHISTAFRPSAASNISDGLGQCGLNIAVVSGGFSLTSGVVYYSPVFLPIVGQVSVASFRQLTALTGGSPTIDLSLYEVGSDTLPGNRLISFTQVTGVGTAATYSSSAIATPQPLVPGWYWQGVKYTANGATSNPQLRSGLGNAFYPHGGLLAQSPVNGNILTVTGSLTDPATAATGNNSNAAIPAIYYS